ncbi:MAG: DUF58 domain-containing protein [Planctomycetota bacterium]|nr:DUF58 domain-containing protein [Planctomycetota bacterium]MDG2143930.1 DUF58 domain-containing protein [Planctomycetota bacterium]
MNAKPSKVARNPADRQVGAFDLPAVPSPRVRFDERFPTRLEGLEARFRALKLRSEGAGGARLAGPGEEFIGHRPFREGEDPRNLDWNLFARFDQPFVRVFKREASERWAVMIDTSASMGLGKPGKLQAACEVAAGLGAIAHAAGARLLLVAAGASFEFLRRTDLKPMLRFLEGLVAEDGEGLGTLVASGSTSQFLRDTGRLFAIGDFWDLDAKDLLGLAGRDRELFLMRMLSPEELDPIGYLRNRELEWPMDMIDVEDGARMRIGEEAARAYEHELEKDLERWERQSAGHRAKWHLATSDDSMEATFAGVLGL